MKNHYISEMDATEKASLLTAIARIIEANKSIGGYIDLENQAIAIAKATEILKSIKP